MYNLTIIDTKNGATRTRVLKNMTKEIAMKLIFLLPETTKTKIEKAD